MPQYFNPLPSCEGRPIRPPCEKQETAFQSTPLMRGETHMQPPEGAGRAISIHSPHARGDRPAQRHAHSVCVFQSTPLMRGETFTTNHFNGRAHNFNPLPSCEGRQIASGIPLVVYHISIHSPHARGDRLIHDITSLLHISIHSPHARGDSCSTVKTHSPGYFNPLPSCEGRQF